MAQALLMNITLVIDRVMVGRLGAPSLAGVDLAARILFFLIIVLTSLGAGAAVLAAQARGAEDDAALRRVTAATLQFSAVVGAMVIGALTFFPGVLLDLLAAPDGARTEAMGFLRIVALGAPALVINHLAAGLLRSLKDTRSPLVIGVGAAALNTALNFAWIFGTTLGPLHIPAMGARGAALATAVAQIAGALLILVRLIRATGLQRSDLIPRDTVWFRRLAALGVPITLDVLAWQAGQLVFTRIISGLGTDAIAARAILEIFFTQSYILVAGFSAATVILVGHDLGRGDFAAARATAHTGIRLSTVAMIVGVTLLFLARDFFLNLFVVPPDVRGQAETLVILFCLLHPWAVPNGVVPFVLRSGGDTMAIFAITATTMLCLGLPLAWLLGSKLGGGVLGAFVGFAAHDAIKGQIFLARLGTGRWERRLV